MIYTKQGQNLNLKKKQVIATYEDDIFQTNTCKGRVLRSTFHEWIINP